MILTVYALHLLASIFVYIIAMNIFECILFETVQMYSVDDEGFCKRVLKGVLREIFSYHDHFRVKYLLDKIKT